jgi:hypothetical protein
MGGITPKEARRLGWVYRLNRWRWATGTLPASELFYLQLFDSAVARAGIAVPPLYPVGSAANAGLLYAVFRLAADFPGLSWLELGAGQSTILIDALVKAGRIGAALTLEHDSAWATRIGARVGHDVRAVPLRPAEVQCAAAQAYDFAPERRYDVVLVDGPIGTPRRSRWGALQILESALADEFVVLFDDAERPGERDTLARFLTMRPAADHVFIHAMKSQCLVFSEKYRAIASY